MSDKLSHGEATASESANEILSAADSTVTRRLGQEYLKMLGRVPGGRAASFATLATLHVGILATLCKNHRERLVAVINLLQKIVSDEERRSAN